tara:strand:- start:6 stop:884 length:879 start_codon:yes stop_codon:yes gene_type:complete
MTSTVKIGDKFVGDGCPVFIIAEIGINHNGSLELAKKLIDAAINAGCDAVKFQKRNPALCVPEEQKNILKETPWGLVTYMEYRCRVEFGKEEYSEIDQYCKDRNIMWFASCWEKDSVNFIEEFDLPCYKISSACLTDEDLLLHIRSKERPILLSTGMSTMEQIMKAVKLVGNNNLVLLHSTSSYPCKNEELNLKVIHTLRSKFNCAIGYSGHEVGLIPTIAAVCLGGCLVERHITLDRTMWGTDQASSIEPHGFEKLVHNIKVVETAIGDGKKCVYPSEKEVMEKLRRRTSF